MLICAFSVMLMILFSFKTPQKKTIDKILILKSAQKSLNRIDIPYSIPTILHQSWKTHELPAVTLLL